MSALMDAYVGCFVLSPTAIWYRIAVNCTMSSKDIRSSPEMYMALGGQPVVTQGSHMLLPLTSPVCTVARHSLSC